MRYQNTILFFILLLTFSSCKRSNPGSPNMPNMNELLPVVATTNAVNIAVSSVTCGGNVLNEGSSAISVKGIKWSISPDISNSTTNSINAGGNGTFSVPISNLSPNTTYFFKAFATNNSGTTYGNIYSFTTLHGNIILTVNDFDGNTYHSVTIGTQTWLVENLNVTHYRNGDAIAEVTDNIFWGNQSTGAFCTYNNTTADYGKLYNWFAVNDPRNIAPQGWHVATDAEWSTLTNYLGELDSCGGKLKETGTTNWNFPNSFATNSSGFTALPGGYRMNDGTFKNIGKMTYFWTATENYEINSWYRNLFYNYGNSHRGTDFKVNGFSVRLIKD